MKMPISNRRSPISPLSIGLVTDYTSMIVLREERFQELGIKRLNRSRVENEQLARQERWLQGVRNNRVDTPTTDVCRAPGEPR